MMMRLLMLGALLGLCVPTAANEVVTVGGHELQVPVPEGLVRIDGVSGDFDRMQQSFVAAQNRMAMYLGQEADLKVLQEGGTPPLKRSMNLQVMKELEPLNVSVQDFQKLKTSVRQEVTGPDAAKEFESFSREVEQKLEDGTGGDASVEVSQPGVIKLLDESPDHITFGMDLDLKIATETEGLTRNVRGYVAWSMIRVHGVVINLYCNANVEGAVERKWARDTVDAWGKAILASNDELAVVMAKVPDTSATEGGMPLILIGGIVGAVIGGIFGVVMALRRKK